jgi:hypothetical protein
MGIDAMPQSGESYAKDGAAWGAAAGSCDT